MQLSGQQVAQDSLVAYWALDSYTEGSTVTDATGKYKMSLYSDPCCGPSLVTGKYGQALGFDAAKKQYALLTNFPVDTSAGAQTSIEFWMKPTIQNGVAKGGTVLSFDQYALVAWTGGSIGFNTGNSDSYGTTDTASANILNKGDWVHVVAVFSNGNIQNTKIYINGVKQTLSQGTNQPNTRSVTPNLYLGQFSSGCCYFDGSVDNVKIYNRELSDADAKNIYSEAAKPASGSSASGALIGISGKQTALPTKLTMESGELAEYGGVYIGINSEDPDAISVKLFEKILKSQLTSVFMKKDEIHEFRDTSGKNLYSFSIKVLDIYSKPGINQFADLEISDLGTPGTTSTPTPPPSPSGTPSPPPEPTITITPDSQPEYVYSVYAPKIDQNGATIQIKEPEGNVVASGTIPFGEAQEFSALGFSVKVLQAVPTPEGTGVEVQLTPIIVIEIQPAFRIAAYDLSKQVYSPSEEITATVKAVLDSGEPASDLAGFELTYEIIDYNKILSSGKATFSPEDNYWHVSDKAPETEGKYTLGLTLRCATQECIKKYGSFVEGKYTEFSVALPEPEEIITTIPLGKPFEFGEYKIYLAKPYGYQQYVEIYAEDKTGTRIAGQIFYGSSGGTYTFVNKAGFILQLLEINKFLGFGDLESVKVKITPVPKGTVHGVLGEAKGYPSNPLNFGAYKIYSDKGSSGKWANIYINDAYGSSILQPVQINKGEEKEVELFAGFKAKLKVLRVTANEDSTLSDPAGVELLVTPIGKLVYPIPQAKVPKSRLTASTALITDKEPHYFSGYKLAVAGPGVSRGGLGSGYVDLGLQYPDGRSAGVIVKEGEANYDFLYDGFILNVLAVTASERGPNIPVIDTSAFVTISPYPTKTKFLSLVPGTETALGDYKVYSEVIDKFTAKITLRDKDGKDLVTQTPVIGQIIGFHGYIDSGQQIALDPSYIAKVEAIRIDPNTDKPVGIDIAFLPAKGDVVKPETASGILGKDKDLIIGNYKIKSSVVYATPYKEAVIDVFDNSDGSYITGGYLKEGQTLDLQDSGLKITAKKLGLKADIEVITVPADGSPTSGSSVVSGTLGMDNYIQAGSYKISPYYARDDTYLSISILNEKGETVATGLINKGADKVFKDQGISVKLKDVKATADIVAETYIPATPTPPPKPSPTVLPPGSEYAKIGPTGIYAIPEVNAKLAIYTEKYAQGKEATIIVKDFETGEKISEVPIYEGNTIPFYGKGYKFNVQVVYVPQSSDSAIQVQTGQGIVDVLVTILEKPPEDTQTQVAGVFADISETDVYTFHPGNYKITSSPDLYEYKVTPTYELGLWINIENDKGRRVERKYRLKNQYVDFPIGGFRVTVIEIKKDEKRGAKILVSPITKVEAPPIYIQPNQCSVLIENGKPSDKLDLIVVGDGDWEDEEFEKAVRQMLDYEGKDLQHFGIFDPEPMKSLKTKFNIWAYNPKITFLSPKESMTTSMKIIGLIEVKIRSANFKNTLKQIRNCPHAESTIVLSKQDFNPHSFPGVGLVSIPFDKFLGRYQSITDKTITIVGTDPGGSNLPKNIISLVGTYVDDIGYWTGNTALHELGHSLFDLDHKKDQSNIMCSGNCGNADQFSQGQAEKIIGKLSYFKGSTEGGNPTGTRTVVDQTDDLSGHQIHLMYVLPSDGADESLDTNGKIAASVAAFQKWLASQAGGRKLKIDAYQNSPDITFFRLKKTDAEIKAYNSYVREQIESELQAAGFDNPGKLYAVYYGGSSNYACGGGAWPPTVKGNLAAVYLKGTPPNSPACSINVLAPSGGSGYWEFSMLHEILHTLGFVATCAPHHVSAGHVSDGNQDLMYSGNLDWRPSTLDIGNDDYFNHNNPNCLDLAKSDYLG